MIIYGNVDRGGVVGLPGDVMVICFPSSHLPAVALGADQWIAAADQCFRPSFPTRAFVALTDSTSGNRLAAIRRSRVPWRKLVPQLRLSSHTAIQNATHLQRPGALILPNPSGNERVSRARL